LQFGQGLVAASGFGVGKGGETINTVRRSDLGVRPYTSVLETTFYRGAAATYNLVNNINLTAFYSNKLVDVSFNTANDTLDQLNEQLSVSDLENSTLQTTGFHRTETEIERKHNIREQVAGANAVYNSTSRNFTAGVTAMKFNYNIPLVRSDAPYNQFEFRGRENVLVSGYYSYNWRNVNFFGEGARSQSGGLATVQGLLASLSNKMEVALVYRNYGRDYHSINANAFGENTRNINEKGFYTGLKVRPASRWEITAYYDRFRFPWLKSGIDAPSGGDEYLVRLIYKPSKTAMIYGQFRTENKEKGADNNTLNLQGITMATRRNYLITADFSPVERLNLRSRVQFSSYNQEGVQTEGYAIAQDISYDFGKARFSARYSIFDTDDSDNRQYMLEKDVLYAFSVPSFSGLGTRVYGVIQYGFSRHLDLWLKVGHTHYRYQDTVGSGLDEIAGPRRTDVRAQVRYRF
jgi:hypothetical protein